MKKYVKGSMTIEAALIFPMIFVICLLFIQLALYLVTVENVKAVCNHGLAIGNYDNNAEQQITSYIEETLKENSFISAVSEVDVAEGSYLVMDTMKIRVHGTFEMLYPMEFDVSVKGFLESPLQFCNTTDLLVQSFMKLKDLISKEE